MDLVRDLLIAAEALEPGQRLTPEAIPEHDRAVVVEHMKLLVQAGLADGRADLSFNGGRYGLLRGLTWEGHDFLAATRSATVWQRVKAKAAEQGGAMAFELMKEFAVAIGRRELGLGDGS